MQLQLTNTNLCAEIDPEDLNKILNHTQYWSVLLREDRSIRGVCGFSSILGKPESLCRIILDYFGPLTVDHIDRNPLNNKKDNLRIATYSQNLANRPKRKGIHTSEYKGVSFRKYRKERQWVARITYQNKGIHGGYFETEELAAIKANELMLKYFGEFAVLNSIRKSN